MLHDGKARRVAVLGGSRIPFCRAHTAYRHESNQDMMTAALQGVVRKFDLRGQSIGDVALGAVIKHSKDFNLARESLIDSGLSLKTPGIDLQRACGTSLEAAVLIGNKIALGQVDSGIAGG
ncbi:MAG: acetyl-CoA C-acyltransferase, partial [Pseudomonadota bacterium]